MEIYQLFAFAFFPNYDESISYLAFNLAAKEEWNYSGSSKKNFPILKNYIEFTYRRLKQERKIAFTSDNKFACFNTGLVTENLEEIYAFFEIHRDPQPNSSPYVFQAFLKKSDKLTLKHFSTNLPDIANYFENPELLIYNPKCNLIVNIDHIIDVNLDRFPGHLQVEDKAELRRQVFGAIEEVKKKIRINYKIAVPQFYNNKIQLLLPLCLTAGSPNPDLAIVIQKLNEKTYSAQTCLTIRMAYNNARLIVRPESNWLKP